MSGKPEYLEDGVWHGRRPPSRFVGVVRDGKKEWTKAEVTPRGRDHKGRVVGHVCCSCPACAAYEAAWCPDRPAEAGGEIPTLFDTVPVDDLADVPPGRTVSDVPPSEAVG